MNPEPMQGTVPLQLAEIWCDALKVERVDEDSDFFALGGHSLLAIRVSLRAGDAFGVEVASGDLVADSSFHAMVERIEAALLDGSRPTQALA